MKISEIKPNPNNPRLIKDDKFKKLVKSLESFPEMMEKRPIVCVTDVDGKLYPLGGNMRLKALKELKYNDIPDSWVTMADEWTEEQRMEFLIKDNVGFGEWDFEVLENEWDSEQLEEWGMDLPIDEKLNKIKDGDSLEFEQSVQLIPPKEYILIMAEPNSEEWEEIKESLKLKMVRRGGYKEGSSFDAVSLERVLNWNDFKERYVNSDTK
jgi:hypothetical protein